MHVSVRYIFLDGEILDKIYLINVSVKEEKEGYKKKGRKIIINGEVKEKKWECKRVERRKLRKVKKNYK